MLLAEQMKIIAAHQTKAPVKMTPIAKALGLTVYNVPDWPKNISGMIRRDKDRGGASGFAIFVNGAHPNTRKRFTIAHEIAHYVLHESLIGDGVVEDALLRAEGLSNRVEAQANQFAADMLMPWNLISDYQNRGVQTVEELASAFEVSKDAMSIRLLGVPYQKAIQAAE
jgi:Zn-dependent peptidase ImmA (M78 family)